MKVRQLGPRASAAILGEVVAAAAAAARHSSSSSSPLPPQLDWSGTITEWRQALKLKEKGKEKQKWNDEKKDDIKKTKKLME